MMPPHDYARIRQIRPEPIEAIQPANPERMPPAPSIWLWLLMVIPIWWLVALLMWRSS